VHGGNTAAVSLLTEECTMSEYIESLTMYASNACTEVLSGIEPGWT
jgi:hypothetical protein